MPNTGANDGNDQRKKKDIPAGLISDEAIEAAAGIDCACTYLPSRLSTTFRFIDTTLIRLFNR